MRKRAVSVTLTPDNLTWLKARAAAGHARSISAVLDQLVAAARATGASGTAPRSVVGTIAIPASDRDLARADDTVRRLFTMRPIGRVRTRTPAGKASRGALPKARPHG